MFRKANHAKCVNGENCTGPGCRYSKPKRVERKPVETADDEA